MAGASVMSATDASAPRAARGCRWAAFLATARTFFPRERRVLATMCPVLPLAPRMTYIGTSISTLDAGRAGPGFTQKGRIWGEGKRKAGSSPGLRPVRNDKAEGLRPVRNDKAKGLRPVRNDKAEVGGHGSE